jgi:predicted PurR-regulated permease PerM
LLVVFFAIIPPLINEAKSLIAEFPKAYAYLQNEVLNPKNPVVQKLPPDVIVQIQTLPSQASSIIAKYGFGVAQATLGGFFSVVTLFLSLIIVPVLMAYFFFDVSEVKRGLTGLIPAPARPRTIAIVADVNKTLGAFVRGQALDGLILGTLIAIMLGIMHVRYALLIGVAAGILNLIPYVGALIGFIPAVLLALVFNGWQNALIVAILFAVIQQLDGNVILPRIMKDSVQLSPLVIIIAILLGSAYFGVIGTFLAVPGAAILRVLTLHFAPAPTPAQMGGDEQRAVALEVL